MVAAEYFDLRSNLGAALFSLGRVAELAGLKPSRTPIVKSLAARYGRDTGRQPARAEG